METSVARLRVLTSVLAACLYAGTAHATPNNGFGVYLGALSSSDSSLYGNSHGGLIAADAQFMVDEHWSLNPYLLLDSESTGQSFDINNYEGGLQARYWMGGDTFVAPQFLFHDTLLKKGGTVSSSLYGPGVGLAAGWEGDSHWSVMLAANIFRLAGAYGSPATTRSEAMLLIGYHWY
ncbi:MAG TPA: hypothetical protein VGH91_12760 [Gammaproteobacteria bacterium]|jgi:hypothetical protein